VTEGQLASQPLLASLSSLNLLVKQVTAVHAVEDEHEVQVPPATEEHPVSQPVAASLSVSNLLAKHVTAVHPLATAVVQVVHVPSGTEEHPVSQPSMILLFKLNLFVSQVTDVHVVALEHVLHVPSVIEIVEQSNEDSQPLVERPSALKVPVGQTASHPSVSSLFKSNVSVEHVTDVHPVDKDVVQVLQPPPGTAEHDASQPLLASLSSLNLFAKQVTAVHAVEDEQEVHVPSVTEEHPVQTLAAPVVSFQYPTEHATT